MALWIVARIETFLKVASGYREHPANEGATVRAGSIMLQLARILALIGLLGLVAEQNRGIYSARASFELAEMQAWWVMATLINSTFIAVVLVGRRATHAWALLAVEAVVAGALALVLPLQWAVWFGFDRWTYALGDGLLQTLALAWFGVVVATGIRQARDAMAARRRARALDVTASD